MRQILRGGAICRRLLLQTSLSVLMGIAAAIATVADAAPMSWQEVKSLPTPPKGLELPYGDAPEQFGILRTPQNKNKSPPYPVVMLLHGGCWSNAFSYRYFEHLAAALPRKLGVASWNVEYRRIGDKGGGWPGTFRDVRAAFNAIGEFSDEHSLNPDKILVMGHSAGGHLALWLGARVAHNRKPDAKGTTASLIAVIGLAPIADLVEYSGGPGGCNAAVKTLLNGKPAEREARYLKASPADRLPLGVPQWLIQGLKDSIVNAGAVRRYADKARAAGDRVELIELDDAGHFEPVVPDGKPWEMMLQSIEQAFE